jgi:hypothetical protein
MPGARSDLATDRRKFIANLSTGSKDEHGDDQSGRHFWM